MAERRRYLLLRQVGGDSNKARFCIVRPPGHHASKGRAHGFCLRSNVAIDGIRNAVQHYDKVVCVDIDLHIGDGTISEIRTMDKKDKVLFSSVHASETFEPHPYPFFPSHIDDTVKPFRNATFDVKTPDNNILVHAVTDVKNYRREAMEHFELHIEQARRHIEGAEQRSILIVSMGLDAHHQDTYMGGEGGLHALRPPGLQQGGVQRGASPSPSEL